MPPVDIGIYELRSCIVIHIRTQVAIGCGTLRPWIGQDSLPLDGQKIHVL